jgi:hypothetical protein
MSGAIPPLLQYAFMAWCSVKGTGTALPLPLPVYGYIRTHNLYRFSDSEPRYIYLPSYPYKCRKPKLSSLFPQPIS